MDLNLTSKEVTGHNAPVGAALVAQAMNGGDVSMRYKAMQAVKDWDRTRLGYRFRTQYVCLHRDVVPRHALTAHTLMT